MGTRAARPTRPARRAGKRYYFCSYEIYSANSDGWSPRCIPLDMHPFRFIKEEKDADEENIKAGRARKRNLYQITWWTEITKAEYDYAVKKAGLL